MSGDFFDHLEAELAELTRQGAHLTRPDNANGRLSRVLRRGAAGAITSVVLAVALVGEFPASATAHPSITPTVMIGSL